VKIQHVAMCNCVNHHILLTNANSYGTLDPIKFAKDCSINPGRFIHSSTVHFRPRFRPNHLVSHLFMK